MEISRKISVTAFGSKVTAELGEVVECNCSLCLRSGFPHWYVRPEQVRLLTTGNVLSTYAWRSITGGQHFCPKAARKLPPLFEPLGSLYMLKPSSSGLALRHLKTRLALDTWLSRDPYVTEKVWQRTETKPFRLAVLDGKITP